MMSIRQAALVWPALALVASLGACAPRPPASDKAAVAEYQDRNDPLEPTNRVFFKVNDVADRYAVKPVARAYRDDVPEGFRSHLHNVLSNLGNPAQFTNDVLQGKPHKAGNTFMRLLLNSTAGLGGVFDVATGLGFPDHANDFGLTLAVWGVPGGPFLFLPVLGPSNPRDGVGYGVNTALDPLTWASFGGSTTLGTTRFVAGAIDGRARVLDATDSIDTTALDRYATYRSLAQQHRASAVAAAGKDLPATVPNWYANQVAPNEASRQALPAPVSPTLAPPQGLQP